MVLLDDILRVLRFRGNVHIGSSLVWTVITKIP